MKSQLKVAAGRSFRTLGPFMRDIDGQWFGCGSNEHGQLLYPCSHVSRQIELTAIELPNHKPIIEIHTGAYCTLLKDNEGNWYGCGSNRHGQLSPNTYKMGQVFCIDPTVFEQVEKANLLESRPKMC